MGWYGSAFLLPQPVLQPSFGKAYPFGNTKYMFIFGLVVFESELGKYHLPNYG
jgi:hypothetical protein